MPSQAATIPIIRKTTAVIVISIPHHLGILARTVTLTVIGRPSVERRDRSTFSRHPSSSPHSAVNLNLLVIWRSNWLGAHGPTDQDEQALDELQLGRHVQVLGIRDVVGSPNKRRAVRVR